MSEFWGGDRAGKVAVEIYKIVFPEGGGISLFPTQIIVVF